MTNLSKFLCILIMHRHNLQMVHWNVVGKHFSDVHTTLDGYVDTVTGNIDQVAEFIKMLDLDEHLPSFIDVSKFITDDETVYIMVGSEHIGSKTAWSIIDKVFDDLIKYGLSAREECPPDIQSEIDSMIYYYRTEGKYKCKARLSEAVSNED